MPSSNVKVALVSGANRGIGFEVCRQLAELGFTVLLGARDIEKGNQAAVKLAQHNLSVIACQLDITDAVSIERVRASVEDEYGHLDVLINNAAILYDYSQKVLSADLNTVLEAFETNTIGAWGMCQAFAPLIRRSAHGRIVNVSSEAGSLTSMGNEAPAYSVSKVALNAVTRMVADELRESHVLVNSVCPGWVATEMGGAGGRPIPEGAASVVWAVTLPDHGPTGGFFRDGKPLPW